MGWTGNHDTAALDSPSVAVHASDHLPHPVAVFPSLALALQQPAQASLARIGWPLLGALVAPRHYWVEGVILLHKYRLIVDVLQFVNDFF